MFHFPPGRKPRVDKLTKGSICLVLTRRGPDRREWLFVGEFVVRGVRRVSGEEFLKRYVTGAVEVGAPPSPRPASGRG